VRLNSSVLTYSKEGLMATKKKAAKKPAKKKAAKKKK
jgi:hypothetical protein